MGPEASHLLADQTARYQLQCTDCYRIFPSMTPPLDATCEACGSENVVRW